MSEVNVSSFVFNKIKIEAKNLKKTRPSFTHMQRLDEASKNVAGKRHYHEANRLHGNYIKANAFSTELTLY